jgi:3-methyladenine DNA glycosylase AlkD
VAQHTELADFVCGELSRAADPVRAVAMAAYMKTTQPFYGVPAPHVHAIAKEARRCFLPGSRMGYEWNVLGLWQVPQREARYIAIDYAKQPAFLLPQSIPLYERMIREGAWWDFVDGISSNLVGLAYLSHRHAVRPLLECWIEDADFWIRRSALLAHLRHKSETDAEQLFRHCLKCAAEPEFFIRKAIGWTLREYSKTNPAAVMAFLTKHRESLSPLSLREGARHLIRLGKLPEEFPAISHNGADTPLHISSQTAARRNR